MEYFANNDTAFAYKLGKVTKYEKAMTLEEIGINYYPQSYVYLNKHPEVPRILTIACFNEWSEGHYLLPDNRFGYGMLDALGEALGKGSNHKKHGIWE